MVRVADRLTALRLVLDPDLSVGECYMDGSLSVDRGTIYDFLALVMSNAASVKPPVGVKIPLQIRHALRRLHQRNPIGLARRNVAHHYDLTARSTISSSIATGNIPAPISRRRMRSLEDAQLAKKRHLAAKLALKPGMRVLDIGSRLGRARPLSRGAPAAPRSPGSRCPRSSTSVAQSGRGSAALRDRVAFQLHGLPRLEGTFDRIVSVGMFEHVGVGHYDEFFRKVRRLLKDDGVAAAPFDRPLRRARRHQRLDREIHFPRRLHPGAVRSGAGDREEPASTSPTSRSCACITPRRCANGGERFLAHRDTRQGDL